MMIMRRSTRERPFEQAWFDAHAPETGVLPEDPLAELQRFRDELNRIPTGDQMNEHTEYSRSTYQKRFGSWSAALEEVFDEITAAGVRVSHAELPDVDWRVTRIQRPPPRFATMREHGRPPGTHLHRAVWLVE